MHTLWPMQTNGIREVIVAIDDGHRRILVTAPTGCGKSYMMAELANTFLNLDEKVVLYTNRKMLLDQMSGVLESLGFDHGKRASGHFPEMHHAFQVSSIQTEYARVVKKEIWTLHDAKLVLIDEAHIQRGEMIKTVVDRHLKSGAIVVGFTATPIDLDDYYDVLIVAGNNSEGRECGALVPAIHYGPDEPDLKHIGRVSLGDDLTEGQNVKAMMTPTIFARVYEWWRKLNPDGKPTILFAPGVAESVWFAEQFHANGVSAAHIDGEEVWVNGELTRTNRKIREEVLNGSKTGRIDVLCNRFVLREGIDAPWLAHGIFATVFGSLQSYLQSGGRILRAHPGIQTVTIQDHGGNWHRHGSLNADREWDLGQTSAMIAYNREQRLRSKKEKEPFLCPQCSKVLMSIKCPCGFMVDLRKKSRPVVQVDGTLKEHRGDIYAPRHTETREDTAKTWKQMYWRARNSKNGMTFLQAEALFAVENHYWPDRSLGLMPRDDGDWLRRVAEVPRERLK